VALGKVGERNEVDALWMLVCKVTFGFEQHAAIVSDHFESMSCFGYFCF